MSPILQLICDMDGNESENKDRESADQNTAEDGVEISCRCLNVQAKVRRVDDSGDGEKATWTVVLAGEACRAVSWTPTEASCSS